MSIISSVFAAFCRVPNSTIRRDRRTDSLESRTVLPEQCTYYKARPDGTVCYQLRPEHFKLPDEASSIPNAIVLEPRIL